MPTTYNDLIAYAPLATYAANRDMVAELPKLVRRAQTYVVQRLDHDLFSTTLPLTTIAADGTINTSGLTDLFLELRSVAAEGRSGYFPLLPRALNMLDTLYPTTRSGEPLYYGRVADRAYRAYPRPGRVINARLEANMAPAPLGPGTQTNIITELYPEVIEVALLREAAVFNLDMDQVQLYSAEIDMQLSGSNAQTSRHTRDETSQRPRETRNVTGS